MIKLKRNFTPLKLNPHFVATQTAEFKVKGTNVWNVDWLKEALLSLSSNKCAYCECALRIESKYMEVEHFEDKSRFPDKVLEWENLLPSCKRCNGAKGTHDVSHDPIVNPFVNRPSDNFYFRLYKIKGKTGIGMQTEDVINLNHLERAVKVRFEIGEGLEELIENIAEKLALYKQNKIARRKNRLLSVLEGTLFQCQPDSIYSATCATVLHSNTKYEFIMKEMQTLDLWTSEHQDMHIESLGIVYEMN